MPLRALDRIENLFWPVVPRTRHPGRTKGLQAIGKPQISASRYNSTFAAYRAPESSNALDQRRRTDSSDYILVESPIGCEEEEMSDEQPETSDGRSGSDLEQVHKRIKSSIFLRIGMVFNGSQKVLQRTPDPEDSEEEQYGVRVAIQDVDLERGSCSGSMRAQHIPSTSGPVTTYWIGEIIDDVNNSFVTCKWGASYAVDMAHWKEFAAFAPLRKRVMRRHGRCNRLHEQSFIFMRWKEQYFLENKDNEGKLTIAGFYYVCLDRRDGTIEGFYFDPSSMPHQKLELKPASTSSYYTKRTLL